MRSQEFLAAVRDQAAMLLPESLCGFHSRTTYGMLQLHYGEPRVHYEVWLVRKTGRIEIGLHFEADRETNRACAASLAGRVFEFYAAFGPAVDLEEWGPSWTRLHLTVPLEPLDEDLSRDVAIRLTDLMRLTGSQVAALVPRQGAAVATREREKRHWRRRT